MPTPVLVPPALVRPEGAAVPRRGSAADLRAPVDLQDLAARDPPVAQLRPEGPEGSEAPGGPGDLAGPVLQTPRGNPGPHADAASPEGPVLFPVTAGAGAAARPNRLAQEDHLGKDLHHREDRHREDHRRRCSRYGDQHRRPRRSPHARCSRCLPAGSCRARPGCGEPASGPRHAPRRHGRSGSTGSR